MPRRRLSPLSFALSIVLLLPLGCDRAKSKPAASTGPKPRIAYITNGVASFWVIAQKGADDGAKEYNAEATVIMPNGVEDQKQKIEDLLVRGVDGIAISPIDPRNQTPLIDKACRQTNVITQDSDAPDSRRLLYLGMDNYVAGRMCGQLVKEAIPNGGKVAIFVGRLEQDNARLRRQGVIDELLDRSRDPSRNDPAGQVLAGAKYTVIGTWTDQFEFTKAKSNTEDVVNRNPDLACVVGLFAYNPPLCIEALKGLGKLDRIKVVGFDEEDGTLQGIKDGACYGTVVQNPYMYGKESVRILAALARGDKSVIPAGKTIEIPARQIRRDNVDAFWADLKQKLAR